MSEDNFVEFTEQFEDDSAELWLAEGEVVYRPFPHKLEASEYHKNPVWRVRLEFGDEPTQTIGLDINDDIVLGRGTDLPNQIDLNAYAAGKLGVSRRHLMLRPTPNKLFAIEMGSTNGTLRNGRSLGFNTPYSLMSGDVLTLGRLTMAIEIVDRPRSQTTWLARELNLADALSEIGQAITSQLELEEVFNQVTETAHSLTAAGETSIWLIDEETSELFLEVERGMADEQVRRMRIPIDAKNPAGKVIQSGQSLRVSRQPGEAKIKLKTNYLVEALIYVPITLGGATFGVLSAVHREKGKQFSERDEHLLRAIAQFAAIAIQNARLYEATDEALARRVTELAALNEVTRSVSASLDLEQVCRVLAAQLNNHWPVQAIRLYSYVPVQQLLVPMFTSDGVTAVHDLTKNPGIMGKVAQSGETIMSNEVAEHPDYVAVVDDLAPGPPESMVCVPLWVQEEVIGVLALLNKTDGRFTNEDVTRLELFSHPVATAIENAYLFTEVKRQKAAIETTAQVLRQPLILLDDNGGVLISNQTANDILENNMAQLFQAISDGVGRTQEVNIGEEMYLSTTEHVDEVGTIVVMQDITYVKQLEKDRVEFMYALSHDLKNPLTSIMGWAQLVQRVSALPEQGQAYMQRLITAADSMLGMINQLLQSVEQVDAVQVLKKPCRFEEMVVKVISDVEGAALSKNILVTYEQAGLPYALMADEMRLYHMILNLVDNAVKYSPENTRIEVRLQFSAEQVVLQVRDEGVGIPEKDIPFIFDKYYRGVQSEGKQHGAGLGLALVKAIVEAHEGTITVQNVPQGGALFEVKLPGSLRVREGK
ncbi:MAG: GAF domain-containing protein [Ardenticatenaceae bacterium]|nr:GAF domain-containing protein [Ardenticatenaceae bacterium]